MVPRLRETRTCGQRRPGGNLGTIILPISVQHRTKERGPGCVNSLLRPKGARRRDSCNLGSSFSPSLYLQPNPVLLVVTRAIREIEISLDRHRGAALRAVERKLRNNRSLGSHGVHAHRDQRRGNQVRVRALWCAGMANDTVLPKPQMYIHTTVFCVNTLLELAKWSR